MEFAPANAGAGPRCRSAAHAERSRRNQHAILLLHP